MKKLPLVCVISFFLISHMASGQGCSDAGFCSINSLKPHLDDSVAQGNNKIKLGFNYGKADHSISNIGSYVEYNRRFSDRISADLKINSLSNSGNNISTFGISDVYVNANIAATENLRIIGGFKIPLSKSDERKNDLPLPMDYQPGLGTFDLIIGLGYSISKIKLAAAIQYPLTQNSNQFFNTLYADSSELKKFHSTNNFKRSGDALLRISYPISIGNNLTVTPGILPIYHLADDKYTDEFNIERSIKGSQGLTLNGNLHIDYTLSKSSALQLSTGMPFIVRETRPDGLTRSFVVNLEYSIKF
jgi:hypothetical protein